MKALRFAAGIALIAGLAGCGASADQDTATKSDQDTATKSVMPGVKGRQLDVAKDDIKRAGFEDEVDVDGGGTFGVVVESNWKVCDQSPAAGKPITATPRLTVDRSCGDDDVAAESTKPPAKTAPPTTNAPKPPEVLTAANSADLAALLAGSDCDDTVERFASKYRGQTIEFDGNIADMTSFGSDKTRFDMLVYAGDYNETFTGPNFKFADVNMFDLNLTGSRSSVANGDNVHVKAQVGDFNRVQCLFFLDPVSTEVR